MKICLISNADALYPYGSTARPYYLGKHLVNRGFDVLHICKMRFPEDDGVEYLSLNEYSGRSSRDIFSTVYDRCRWFSPDIIYSHQVYTVKPALKLKYLLQRPHVYDPHGSVALENRLHTNQSLKRRTRLRNAERTILKATQKIIAPSPELKDFLMVEYHLPEAKCEIIKNGVETDTFTPQPASAALRRKLGIRREAKVIVFTNPRSFPSNELALRYLFKMIPEVRQKCPEAVFVILGGGPELKTSSEQVIYTGHVEQLPPYINLSDVCIAPFPPQAVCGGTRNKICEYLACGKAIVSTKEGMRGFDDAINGEHYLLAQDSKDFVAQLAFCMNNKDKAQQMGDNARKLAAKYDWRVLARQLQEVFQTQIRA